MGPVESYDSSKGTGVLVVSVVFWAIAAAAVGLRVGAQRIKKHALEFNDDAIFVALVSHFLSMPSEILFDSQLSS